MTKYWTSTLFPTADHSRARKELSANLVGVTEKQYNEKKNPTATNDCSQGGLSYTSPFEVK